MAYDGSAAIEKALLNTYDVVVLDRDLPGRRRAAHRQQRPVVPPEAVPTLAEPFRRITKQPDGGVGLGLSIAQSVSLAHGAQLDIRGQPDGGLAVSLTLPARL